MAASAMAGGKGQRKSLGRPRLTGRAIQPIQQHLDGISTSPEAVLATGMMICEFWETSNEHLLPSDLYDMDFIAVKEDPTACVKLYVDKTLENSDYDGDIEKLMLSAIDKGYVTYDTPPFTGFAYIPSKVGDEMFIINTFGRNDVKNWSDDQLAGMLIGQGLKHIKASNPITYSYSRGFYWYNIIYDQIETYRTAGESIYLKDRVVTPEIVSQYIRDLNERIFDNLDEVIGQMVAKGYIVPYDQ